MTALSLDLMDITGDWVSSLWCFPRPLLLTSVVVCLWGFLSLVLSSASEMHAQSCWDQEIDLAIAKYYTFYLQKLLGCFCCMFWIIVHEAPPNQLCSIWLNLGREYISIHFRILPAASVTSSLNTSNPVPLEAIQFMHHTAPPCFTEEVVWFGSWAVPSLLHTFSSRHSGTGWS